MTWKSRADAATRRFPTCARIVRALLDPDTLDRCFIMAAQLLMTGAPMLIAVTAFSPVTVRDHIMESFRQILGVEGSTAEAVNSLVAGSDQTREAVGVIGLVVALGSATSLTRRMQRLYEHAWTLPPSRMTSAAGRWLAWILVWVATLALQGPLRAGAGVWLIGGWMGSAAMTFALWWWTPHLLLLNRVGWRALLPTALLTGFGVAVLGIGSRILMPTITSRSVAEYGPFGLILTMMSWLLVLAGLIVVGSVVGRILATPGPVEEDRRGLAQEL